MMDWAAHEQPKTVCASLAWGQQVVKGTVIEPQQIMEARLVGQQEKETPNAEKGDQQRQEQTRIRQWEGLLAISMQQHQLKMTELTKATREIQAQKTSTKGKSTQTAKIGGGEEVEKTVLNPKGWGKNNPPQEQQGKVEDTTQKKRNTIRLQRDSSPLSEITIEKTDSIYPEQPEEGKGNPRENWNRRYTPRERLETNEWAIDEKAGGSKDNRRREWSGSWEKHTNMEGRKGRHIMDQSNIHHSKSEHTRGQLDKVGEEVEWEHKGKDKSSKKRRGETTKEAAREYNEREKARNQPIIVTCPPWKDTNREGATQGKEEERRHKERTNEKHDQKLQARKGRRGEEQDYEYTKGWNKTQRRTSRPRGKHGGSNSRGSSREQIDHHSRRRTRTPQRGFANYRKENEQNYHKYRSDERKRDESKSLSWEKRRNNPRRGGEVVRKTVPGKLWETQKHKGTYEREEDRSLKTGYRGYQSRQEKGKEEFERKKEGKDTEREIESLRKENEILKEMVKKLKEQIAIMEKKTEWQQGKGGQQREGSHKYRTRSESRSKSAGRSERDGRGNQKRQREKTRNPDGAKHNQGTTDEAEQRTESDYSTKEQEAGDREGRRKKREERETEEDEKRKDKGSKKKSTDERRREQEKDKQHKEEEKKGQDEEEEDEESKERKTDSDDDKIIQLKMNKRSPIYSTEELEFFAAAIEHRHVSQTHFMDPGADFCYRCPLCRKVINAEGILQKTRIHFDMLHRDSNKEFHITVNHKEESKIIIPARMTGKLRDGATPPTEDKIEQYGRELQRKTSPKLKRIQDWNNEGPTYPEDTAALRDGGMEQQDTKKSTLQNVHKASTVIVVEDDEKKQKRSQTSRAKERTGVNRKTWKKRASKIGAIKKSIAKAVKTINKKAQRKRGKDGNTGEKGVKSKEEGEQDKTDIRKAEEVEGQEKENGEERQQQRQITDYFLTPETGKEVQEGGEDRERKAKNTGKMTKEGEVSKEAKPTYLAIAQKALKSNSPYRVERKK